MNADEVGEVEFAVRFAYEQRSAFREAGDMFAGMVAVSEQSAAVSVAFQRLLYNVENR